MTLSPTKAQCDDQITAKKDFTSLPRPLSVGNLSGEGAKICVSFKLGSYSEAAALKAFPKCETLPCKEFEDAFKAVELRLANKVVFPIENSYEGSIHRNYDLLLHHRLHIVCEVHLMSNLCLVAMPGVKEEQLRRVLGHPQALALSDSFLSKLKVSRENFDDTASAAQFVASNELGDAGVVVNAQDSEKYGLNVVVENIQNNSDNVTRYLVLARDPIIPRIDKPLKTSIVFTLDEGPGVLFKALAVFALRDINLTKIESRPQRKKPLREVGDSDIATAKYFDYFFYIDFEASTAEPRAQNALRQLEEYATFLRVLGCYPVYSNMFGAAVRFNGSVPLCVLCAHETPGFVAMCICRLVVAIECHQRYVMESHISKEMFESHYLTRGKRHYSIFNFSSQFSYYILLQPLP